MLQLSLSLWTGVDLERTPRRHRLLPGSYILLFVGGHTSGVHAYLHQIVLTGSGAVRTLYLSNGEWSGQKWFAGKCI